MSVSHTTIRLVTVLFILAGILLLKPVFGQTTTAAPATPFHSLSNPRPEPINRVCYDPLASNHNRVYIAADVR